MTNEEAIKKDKKYLFDRMMDLIKDEFDERDESYNIGVGECIDILTECSFNNLSSVFQENTKLKAEIEQWQSTNLKLVCELTRIECENHQLKSELEQSVKEKSEVISKIEYALSECEPIYNKCAVIPQAKPVYDLAMNYCLDLLKGQV